MGAFAEEVQTILCEGLAKQQPQLEWETEYRVSGTPVDVAGKNNVATVLIELEWRRADPADNTAKLFRHLSNERIEAQEILVVQVFTNHYELSDGGFSSKRKNAEFVGETAADHFTNLIYEPITLDLDPPKRGGERPAEWRDAVSTTATEVDGLVHHLTKS